MAQTQTRLGIAKCLKGDDFKRSEGRLSFYLASGSPATAYRRPWLRAANIAGRKSVPLPPQKNSYCRDSDGFGQASLE
jgi:hypothetical protein